MIEQGIRTLLVSDSTVGGMVDQRVYSNKLPQNPTLPAIVITTVDGEDRYTMEGAAGGPSFGRFQVDSYGTTVAESRALGKAVKALLSGYRGDAGDEVIQGSFVNIDTDMHDWELETWRRLQDYTINYKES